MMVLPAYQTFHIHGKCSYLASFCKRIQWMIMLICDSLFNLKDFFQNLFKHFKKFCDWRQEGRLALSIYITILWLIWFS